MAADDIVRVGLLIVSFLSTVLPLRRSYALWEMMLLMLSLFYSLSVACSATAGTILGTQAAVEWFNYASSHTACAMAASFAAAAACLLVLAAIHPVHRRVLAAAGLGLVLESALLALYSNIGNMSIGLWRAAMSVLALAALGVAALLGFNSMGGGKLLARGGRAQ